MIEFHVNRFFFVGFFVLKKKIYQKNAATEGIEDYGFSFWSLLEKWIKKSIVLSN